MCLAVAAPASTKSAGPTATGSTSELQQRMQEGAEAERPQRPSSPEVSDAAQLLSAVLVTRYGVIATSEAGHVWQRLIDSAKDREFLAPDLQASQLALALQQVNRLLTAQTWAQATSPRQRLEIAEQLLTQIAFYPEPATTNGDRNCVLAIMQSLLFKFPGLLARDVVDALLTGRFQDEVSRLKLTKAGDHTADVGICVRVPALAQNERVPSNYVERVMYRIAEPQDNSAGIHDTPALQRIYEALSGTEKGSYVLKNGSPFVLSEPDGSHKLFTHDTNYINWAHKLDGASPSLIKTADTSRGYAGSFTYCALTPSVTITEDEVIVDDRVIERIQIKNNSQQLRQVSFAESIDHPFVDMFEVRGWRREKHGQQLAPLLDVADGHARWSYQGLDGAVMSADWHLIGGAKPQTISDHEISWSLSLAPGESFETDFAITPWMGDVNTIIPPSKTYAEFEKEADGDYDVWRDKQATISTGNKKFNSMIEQIYRDIYILREQTPRGPAIAAGLPWFACAFGRDDAITSLQTLPLMPELSRDVLRTLAAYQGTTDNPQTAEKPGKIMHELRVGEMARNHEIPFAPYYGTVDATPLWIMLLGRYVEQTGDLSLARELQPNIDRALQYLDAEVARGNGYLRYGGVGKEALSNQGWKDSGDSVFYADGKLAQPPIALCEVQGYLYTGWQLMAKVFGAEGNQQRAAELQQKAGALQKRFQQDFWMPKRKFVAEALDGQNAQVGIITSNGGQVLMSHLLTAEQQNAVSNRLMQPDMFSGFGIRTLGREQARYFSNSYHDGSVWPHDNSLICWGLHDSSPTASALLIRSLFDVAQHEDDLRLPELFGGYPRNVCNVPIPYPVSCKPQAWADGAMLLMFAAGAGLHIDGLHNTVTVEHPLFPDELGKINVHGLCVGSNRLDLQFRTTAGGWHVDVTNNPGKVTVAIH